MSLRHLTLRDFVIVPALDLALGRGFTALTGETGAGKTMIVSSLRLLSGARADAGRVRSGSQKATVEGRFRLADSADEASDTDSTDSRAADAAA